MLLLAHIVPPDYICTDLRSVCKSVSFLPVSTGTYLAHTYQDSQDCHAQSWARAGLVSGQERLTTGYSSHYPCSLVLFNPNACKLRFTYQTYLIHQARSNLSSFSKFLAFQNTCLPIVTSLALSTPTKDVSTQPRHVPIHLLTHLSIYTSLALSTPA